jgi:hypothetical protein
MIILNHSVTEITEQIHKINFRDQSSVLSVTPWSKKGVNHES